MKFVAYGYQYVKFVAYNYQYVKFVAYNYQYVKFVAYNYQYVKFASHNYQYVLCSVLLTCWLLVFLHIQDEVLECNTEELPVLRSILQPVYYTLIQVLLQKVQYPVDNEFECWTKGTMLTAG